MSEERLDALIVGHSGQDGTLLREQLSDAGESWVGIGSRRADSAGPAAPSAFAAYDVTDPVAVADAIAELRPRCVYYLAAAHAGSSGGGEAELAEHYARGIGVNALGPIHHLEAIRRASPTSRFVFASSSLVFAPTESPEQRIREGDPFGPAEPYAMQKLLAGLACRDFHAQHGLFAAVAYLFNHESVHRRPGYFSSQIVAGLGRILRGESDTLEVGNLEAIVDWSFAGDTVRALRLMLELDTPQDFVVASGTPHTVREFLEVAFRRLGLEMDAHIQVNPALLRRTNSCRIGDPSGLVAATGWSSSMSFEQLVEHLVGVLFEPGATR